ncbi:energy transducer TonB [Mangrovimonas sp. YM274]|uniref:energy transducer TonB n=1 Tax=Mangrovimonas sp. YM274 TaxID=3070660 RepID=UPI0027DE38A7|nr:energy transducer TonB [Mangrovimonas sp. YM274]WMI69402.1 energy transducer TonB [Mangrovimonas sp. YM274]
MKNFNKERSNAGQSTTTVAKSQKHDVNLQKNSTLYFQIGLILCLLVVYGLFEMEFETKVPKYEYAKVEDEGFNEFVMQEFKVYEEPAPQKKVQPKASKKLLIKEPKIVHDNFEDLEAQNIITSNQNLTNDILDAGDIDVVKIEEPVFISINGVENVPIYPGCEKAKGNKARKKCMSDKIAKLVNRKFSADIASDLGLQGVQKIYVEFKIGKSGEVKDIKARAPHSGLEREAKRVINKIPVMTPGMQRDKPVDVLYSLPIIFQVKN